MIKHILFIVALACATAACQNKNNVKITGEFKEAGKQTVYLEQLNVENAVLLDSVKTNRQGEFTLKTAVSSPTFYNLRVGPKEQITFLAEPGQEIRLSGSLNGLSRNYWVEGSEGSLWIKLLNFQLNHTRADLDSLRKAYAALAKGPEDQTTRQRLAAEYDSVVRHQKDFSKDFILKHAISPAAYYALYQKYDDGNFILTPEEDLHSYKVVASSLKAMYPESQYTHAILNHMDQINKSIRNTQIRELIANSENTLPNIGLPNVNGDTISLNSLKGKYIILDFTALNVSGNEAYIRALKAVYNKFKNRGVQIYQVCLDPNRLAWQKTVKALGIDWICVWDAEGLQSTAARLWNIQNIPANYIISPKSEIVGKNLTGKRLEDRLTDILK